MGNLNELLKEATSQPLDENSNTSRLMEAISLEVDKTDFQNFNSNKLYNIARAKSIIESYNFTGNRFVPRVILCTQPKSATKHIENVIMSNTIFNRITPIFDHSQANMLANQIKSVFFSESEYLYGKLFASYHLIPSKNIITHGLKYGIKYVVQIRNPLQSIVSAFHYLKQRNFGTIQTMDPGTYFGPSKISDDQTLKTHLLKYVYPRMISFIDMWFAIKSKFKNLDIRIFSQEELVFNPEKFHYELLQVFGSTLLSNEIQIPSNHNFRKGQTDEWKDFFSIDEQNRLCPLLEDLYSKYPDLPDLFHL